MPFKLFSLHKKEKKGKLKVRSKSSMDLTGHDEPPDQSPDAVFVSPTQVQFRSKSTLHLFPLNKSKSSLHLFEPSKTSSSNQLSVSDVKQDKTGALKKMQRMSVHVMESHPTDFSKPPILFEEKETNGVLQAQTQPSEKSDSKNHISSDHNSKNHVNSGHFIKNHNLDQNNKSHNHLNNSHLSNNHFSHNHVINYHLHPYQYVHHLQDGHYGDHGEFASKSGSYSSFMDTNGRERRLLEIAQLDSYIDYLRRTPEEGIHTASRLCCAQVLRLSFMRLERRYVSDVLHSNSGQDRLDSYYSSPKNFSPTPPKTSHFERRMTSFRRRPPYLQNLKSRHSEWSENGDDEKSDGRLIDGSGDDEQTGFHLGSSGALDEKDIVQSSDSDSGSDSDGFSTRSALAKRKSIPVFPVDIEIY